MTITLAVALAVSSMLVPSTLARGPHDCCKRADAMPRHTSLQCCMPDRPEQTPRQAPPLQVSSAPAPDLAPLLPVASAPPPSFENAVLLTARTTLVGAPPPLYLLHSSLLV